MGRGLADGVQQGQAGGREWRTAPLWGLGQRLFFLHDGRTCDLRQAIAEHSSDGSEANGLTRQFFALARRAAAGHAEFPALVVARGPCAEKKRYTPKPQRKDTSGLAGHDDSRVQHNSSTPERT